ncbi:MAG TPA: MFS transporter, partial [Novosphingobium sp.]|nr:MFS transporter [Novosphingobium sp.]
MPETAAPATASGQAPPAHAGAPMNDRALRLTMTALLMGLFVAMLSNLVVLTAMPRIAADLHATQAHYTWIITSSMLTIAVCTPIWGRLADLFDKKRMMQACVGGYVTCSVFASLAQAPWQIIVARVGIGVCAAGIIILLQTISASIMSARRQAEWLGYRAAVLSVATMGAPSLGGLVTQHLGWRACFVVGVPFAVASILMLEKTLHLPRRPAQRVSVDWPGALLLAGGIVAMMLWVSVLGPGRGFLEPLSLAVAGLGALLLLATVMVEQRASAPVLPLPLLGNRVVALCVLAA